MRDKVIMEATASIMLVNGRTGRWSKLVNEGRDKPMVLLRIRGEASAARHSGDTALSVSPSQRHMVSVDQFVGGRNRKEEKVR